MKKLTLFLIALLGITVIANAQSRGLDFDGVDDNVYCYTGFDPAVTEGTIEFWVNLDVIPTNNPRLISNGPNYLTGDEIYIAAGTGVITTVSFLTGDNLVSSSPLSVDVWTHVAITADGSGSTLYINGEQDDTGGAADFSFSNFRFGGQYTAGYYESIDGRMDEVRVWNDVRTQQEIQANMYSELSNPTSETNLVAYFKLNETSGTSASDASANTYTGTLGGTTFDVSTPGMGIMLGDGSSDDPYQVSYISNLNWIINNPSSWDKHFLQMNDIDAASTSSWNGGFGLLRIGVSEATPFSGTYDGGSFAISDLSHTANCEYFGFFGYTGGAIINNLSIVDAIISSTSSNYQGLLIGFATNTVVSNCGVTGGSISGSQMIGGLVGYTNNGSIFNYCYTSGVIINSQSKVGGLAGYLSAKVNNCYSTSNVSATYGSYSEAGGLIGYLANATVNNSYSTGTITVVSSSKTGGLIGESTGTCNNSFWDITTSGQATSAGGTGKTTTEMQTITTFTDAGWDFTSPIWAMDGGTNGGYPNLESNTSPISWIYSGGSISFWNTGSSWSGGSVPSSSDNVSISVDNSMPIINNQGAVCNNLVITSIAALSIYAPQDLTVNGNLTNNGILTIYSASTGTGSLIVEGTSIGDVKVQRHLTANKWHIVSAPVETQAKASFLTYGANSIALNGSDYGVARYLEATNEWGNYYTSDTTGNFTSGIGYLMRRQLADGSVLFTGTVADADIDVTLSKTDNTGYGWNALGNPFTSAMNATDDSDDAINNLLNVNTDVLEDDFVALYVWDEQDSYSTERNDYKVINNAGSGGTLGQHFIQAGQGFIVKAKIDAATFSFTRAMQTHQTTTPFKSAEISEWADINLIITKEESSTKTRFKFNEQMTDGLDIGYDAGILKGNPDFCLYTQLAEDNGVEFMLQCLPLQNLEMMEIPVGLDAAVGGEITLSIQKDNFPGSLIPVLNDKLLNTQFVFNTESDFYTTTINENTKGFGRFTLTFSSTTDVEDIMLEQAHFRVWYSNGLLNISGEIIGEGQATVYDLNGRKLAIRKLMPSSQNQIQVPTPISGIYLIKVEDAKRSEVLKVVKTGR